MTKTIITFGLNTFTMKGDTTMNDLTPLDALDIVESCLEHFADDPLVAEAAATLAAALDERQELREALRPFAHLSTAIDTYKNTPDVYTMATAWNGQEWISITAGNCRQAHAALKGGESNDPGMG